MKNKILSFLSVLVLVYSLALNVSAAHPVPDLSRNGSITFVMNYGDVLLDGGRLRLYRVGNIAENDGNYYFAPVEKLRGIDVDLNNVTDSKLAPKLVSYGKTARLPVISVPIAEGRAAFVDLSPGLFVVWHVTQLTVALAKENCEVLSMQEKDESLESCQISVIPISSI